MTVFSHRKSIVRAMILAAAMGLTGCDLYKYDTGTPEDKLAVDATITPMSRAGAMLALLPPAQKKLDIAVFAYEDKTGQNEPDDEIARFSRAVTQGAEDILYDILDDVAGGHWFNVIERAGLQELLTERNLIDETARAYRGAQRSPLPALRFGGVIIRGGVIDYDTNTRTGGSGARVLGIGRSIQYREDRVSVALRAVSVATGEVLTSVTTQKTLYSLLDQSSIFVYGSSDILFEEDFGYSRNEPAGLALRHAMELAVFALIMEGAEKGIWSFADHGYQQEVLQYYNKRKALEAGVPEEILQGVTAPGGWPIRNKGEG